MSGDNKVEKIDLEKIDWRGSREFFESLTDELRSLDDHDESYEFTWVGKRKSIIEAGAPINKTLRPDVENSKNWDTTENLFIEGDNLDALKLLQESYLGKVKMIYIDPPYNTGKDFVYHDNFKADTEQYDEDTEYKDDEGNIQFKKNEKTNGRYHSDWLSMMYPRLKLARNLLSDDGVIFISIDDNEQANLKKLCDEVFGEDNFVASFVWRKKYGGGKGSNFFVDMHEFVLCYARSISSTYGFSLPRTEEQRKIFKEKDEYFSDRGGYYVRPLKSGLGLRKTLIYPIECPDGSTVTTQWICAKSTFLTLKNEGRIVFKKLKDGRYNVYKKFYENDNTDGVLPESIIYDLAYNQNGKEEIKEIFQISEGRNIPFENPKPSKLIRHLTAMQHDPYRNGIILDFFSGSGTTAHATMQLNAEDGGNRKWIMVQLPEETDAKSEAFKAGYKTIPEISRERIRRAGDKIAAEHPDTKVDYGFRALRIDDTNHKDVYRPASDYQQDLLTNFVDNIKPDRTDLDLLYGTLTAIAWELNRPIETAEIDGATVYKYDYFGEASGLVACFADEISEEVIQQIAKLKPLTAVFKESSFPDSQAKVNLAEHFRVLSPETKVKVI